MFKRVLVYTYGEKTHEKTMQMAAEFAAQHDAHLIGLYIKPDYANYGSVYGPFPFALIESLYEKLDEYAENNHKAFDDALKKTGARGEWHSMDQYAEGPKPALFTDCIFVSQPDEQITATFNSGFFVDEALISTGVPVVVIPNGYEGSGQFTKPVIGWKESKEASNAVRQCLPLLSSVDKVDVINVASKSKTEDQLIDGIQISEYLTAHGIDCNYANLTIEPPAKSVGQTLADYAANQQKDLIIVGGYSHSRLREIIFGGVTRELLHNSKVPVLMVH